MNKRLKQGVLQAAAASGLFFMARWAMRRRFRIFAYHGVSADIDPALNCDGFFVPPEVFERHLRTLKHHYHVMPLSEMVRKCESGEPLPSCAAAITFDDGYLNNYTEAAPLLAKYALPATFFVTTGFVDGTCAPWWWRVRGSVFSRLRKATACHGVQCSVFRMPDGSERRLDCHADRMGVAIAWEQHLKNLSQNAREDILQALFPEHLTLNKEHPFLSWPQLRELAAQGHEVGAHTVSHISLGHESLETIEWEVAGSLERIRDEVGQVSPVYSYPYGEAMHFTPATADILRRHGCIGGVTTLEGVNRPDTDPFFMRRFNITANHDRYAFRALASGLRSCLRGSK